MLCKHLKAGVFAGFCYLLAGCQATPQTASLLEKKPNIPGQHYIADVPFYAQQDFYCGPTTLAEVFNFYDIPLSPQSIAPKLFIPELDGSLQIEMVAAARQQGLVAYAQRGNLETLLSLVAEDIPVVVLQNVALSWFPMWHYALVIGYDLDSREVIMHTGVTENHRLNLATFERTWGRGKYWLMAAVPPTKISAQFTPLNYTQAAQDLLATGQIAAGISALQTAIAHWPDYWLSYFLLANHFLHDDPRQAAIWYQKGYQYGAQNVPYLNNYAFTLATLGCYSQANNLVVTALAYQPDNSNLLDTQMQIAKLSSRASVDSKGNQTSIASQCSLIR
ncbi:MAG: tetratricopeptide (TPR) repeat protein [Paraglaciecola sp.]